jgi:DNA-binding transcriptional LysR family regulator
MHLDLNLLRVFVAVAETRSFTAAASQLQATQSTVSHRIHRLENQLDRRLFERSTRSTKLTEAGRSLLPYARQIEAIASDIRAELGSRMLSGEVHLSVPEDFIDAGFAEVFARFRRLQPKVRMELRIGLAAEQAEWLESGEIDLAVTRSVDPATADEAWWTEPIHWVGSRQVARELAAGRLRSLPLVHVPEPCLYRRLAFETLAERAIPWHVVMTCPHLEGIRAAVRAGLGVAAVPVSAAPANEVVLDERHGLPPLPACNLLLRQRRDSESIEAVEALKQVITEYHWHGR